MFEVRIAAMMGLLYYSLFWIFVYVFLQKILFTVIINMIYKFAHLILQLYC